MNTPNPSARIKALFDTYDQPDTPGGFATAVIKEGSIIFKKAYGTANYEHKIPFTTSTVTDYASVAKQFTGFAIATLIQERKLSLEDEIHHYLPELPDFGTEITIRHLLHHTSGIRDWVGLVQISGRHEGDAITSDFIMKLTENQKELNFKPGDSFQYSNTGYFLLAHIVAQITMQTFAQWCHEIIFQPLEMNDTYFCDDYRKTVPNQASSYKQSENGQYLNMTNQLESPGSSSLFSTLDDMIKWMANYETKALGGPEIWEMMCQPGKLNNNEEIAYGFGISIENSQGLESIGHGGSWAGNLCQLSYYPEQKITTILMINRDPAGFTVDTPKLMRELSGEEEQEDAPNPQASEHTKIRIETERLADYVGSYQSSAGGLMWVERNDEQLGIISPSGQRVLIYPQAKDSFFGKGFDIQFSFLRNNDSIVDRFVYTVGDNESEPFHKLDDRASAFDGLDAFCGDYYCPELRTSYTVMVKRNRLVLTHLQNEDVLLQQVGPDCYRGNKWWCTEIKITRDQENQVSSFRLAADSNNIQNLLFVREPSR